MLQGIDKIRAWQLADQFAIEVYKATKSFPREEMFGLTSQIRRAAVAVAANIVEGSQRQYLKEYVQFLYVAKGSLTEVQYYIHLAMQLGYLPQVEADRLVGLHDEAARTLQGLIAWLEGQMVSGKVKKNDLKKPI